MSARAVIDSLEFARAGRELHGSVTAADLARLQDIVQGSTESAIEFVLKGGSNSQGRPVLHLEFDGLIHLQCQRCQETLRYPLHVSNTLLVLKRGEMLDLELDDPDFPDYIEAVAELDVLTLLEDEILLAVPYAPRHEESFCGQTLGKGSSAGARAFDGLSALKST